MPTKEKLLKKLYNKKLPNNFSIREFETLMSKCECTRIEAGRGSGIKFMHSPTMQALVFDLPHPGKDLYPYQIKAVRKFLENIGEAKP